MEKVLEDLGSKLYKARVTDEIKETRERLCAQAKKISDELNDNFKYSDFWIVVDWAYGSLLFI